MTPGSKDDSLMDGLVAKALDLPPRKRPGFLDTACHGNPELRRRVEVRLEVLDDATEIGEASPPSPRGPGQAGHHTEASRSGTGTGDNPEIGASIGRYKLLEKIGEGGFGLVYVAEQSEPVRRRVALKVIKLGMDTKQVVARFEAERQALAMMDHPNIAKIL
ncbi:MAG: hypothetical protein RLZ45_80, partial [Verrucomicrobiota bacterium]